MNAQPEPTPPLAENHERIWLAPRCNIDERSWCEDPQSCDDCGMEAVEYIRADLVAEKLSKMRKALEHATVYMNVVPPPPELRAPMQRRVDAVAQALAD